MRLTKKEKEEILNSILSVDPRAKVYLFGSRTDDSKKGGDIDLAVLSTEISRENITQIRLTLFDKIGEQKIDFLCSSYSSKPMLDKAVRTGILLNE